MIITFTEFQQTQRVINAIKQGVPEALEASLMLVSHVLSMSGVPMSRIIRRVSSERRNRYKLLYSFFCRRKY